MIQSVERALGLLNLVARHDNWVGVRELARQANLKAPTAYNLLHTMASRGFLDFDDKTRRYRVGLAILLLARRVERLPRLAAFVRPYLEQIFSEVGETTVVCAMIAGRVVIVDHRQGNQPISVAQNETIVEHPHTLASGKLLLAFCGESARRGYAERETLVGLGPNVPRTPGQLLADLKKVRRQGYAETVNARGYGIGAVAAPVFGAAGDVEMAIACSAPLTRFNKKRRREVLSRLFRVADDMSRKFCDQPSQAVSQGRSGKRGSA
ncbi:MAG: IclR family transcriptional regulator [Planctomycetes bacterium]|nr:IclR family transcriptional regulator [Planctomycetota bacterium]